MKVFTEWLSDMEFIMVPQNGVNYFRRGKHEDNPKYHDCPGFAELDEEYCPGCRGCIYSIHDIIHSFLTYLIEIEYTDEQLSKYFNLEYVNTKKHRRQFPGGCYVKLPGDDTYCDYQKMFKLNGDDTETVVKCFCV